MFTLSASLLAAQPRPLIGNGTKHAHASIASIGSSRTGAELLVTLSVDPGWHVSWRNPGDTGLPTRLVWTLPNGVRVRNETWPVPVIAHTNVGATHTLEGEIPWVISFAADSASAADRLLTLTIKYGVCRDVCIPEQLTVQGVLPGFASSPKTVISEAATARLAPDRGWIAARRRSPTQVCLDRVPLTGSGALPEVIADSGLSLDAALPLTPASTAARHGFVMNISSGTVLPDRAKVLVVHGKSGVAAYLDFHRPAPGCAVR